MVTSDSKLSKPMERIFSGNVTGFLYTMAIGFGLYVVLMAMPSFNILLDHGRVLEGLTEGSIGYRILWFIMNFTEAQFYAGVVASLGIIIGGFVAWRLAVKGSKYAGIEVCYGSATLWPWVFASQVISLTVAIFVLNYTNGLVTGDYGWLPTFITVVGVPPSMMLLYGPSWRVLWTSSILGGVMSFPIAYWMMVYIVPILDVPGVVANVLTMAVTGIIVGQILKALPWIKKVPVKPVEKFREYSQEEEIANMKKPSWFVRRVFADFSEAQFYGNEIAGLFVVVAVSLEWILNSGHSAYGSGLIPAILLSQFIGAGVGLLLYFHKYEELGWYATYVPVVSVSPAAVLLLGGGLPVAITAGILGGILGGPIAEYLAAKLPEHIHPTVANVTSMAISTIVTVTIITAIPYF